MRRAVRKGGGNVADSKEWWQLCRWRLRWPHPPQRFNEGMSRPRRWYCQHCLWGRVRQRFPQDLQQPRFPPTRGPLLHHQHLSQPRTRRIGAQRWPIAVSGVCRTSRGRRSHVGELGISDVPVTLPSPTYRLVTRWRDRGCRPAKNAGHLISQNLKPGEARPLPLHRNAD